MFDVEQRRRMSVEELRDHLVGGGNFEAETEETGRDCTLEVLRSVLGAGAADAPAGPVGLPMPGLGALSTSVELLGVARMMGDRIDGLDRDDRGEDRPSSRRARRRSRPLDWAGGNESLPSDGESG